MAVVGSRAGIAAQIRCQSILKKHPRSLSGHLGIRDDSQSVRFAGCFSPSSCLLIVILICNDVKQAAASSEVSADGVVDVGKGSAVAF